MVFPCKSFFEKGEQNDGLLIGRHDFHSDCIFRSDNNHHSNYPTSHHLIQKEKPPG